MQDRVVVACRFGDVSTADAAIRDGANVNEAGSDHAGSRYTPLAAGIRSGHRSLVLHLLSLGADANGHGVMREAARRSADMLMLLMDAGGDVNMASDGINPLLFSAVGKYSSVREDVIKVLLAEPSLDLTNKANGKTAEETAIASDKPAIAALIRAEVSHDYPVSVWFACRGSQSSVAFCVLYAVRTRPGGKTSEIGTSKWSVKCMLVRFALSEM